MLKKFRKETSALDEAIKRMHERMQRVEPDTEEYLRNLGHLERLMELKAKEPRFRISPDTMLIVGGNLLGILIIVGYEQAHVMSSRALSFIGFRGSKPMT